MLKKAKKIAKNLLANSTVRRFYNGINRTVLTVFGSQRILGTIFSFVSFLTFNREQYAVIRGRRNYYRNLRRSQRTTHVELRRNIHRLEKGIIMTPRRPIFARDYIGETIEFYQQAIEQYVSDANSIDLSELAWASSVLERYFTEVSKGDTVVDDARSRYEAVASTYSTEEDMTPYEHSKIVKSEVTYDQLLALANQRRSVRWFKKKKVSRALIDKALMVARQSPTACNRLPYEFRVFDDPEMVKVVSDIPFGASGYSQQIPLIVVVVGKLDSYFSPRDRHAIYVDSSLAAMSFMFGLETLGLSSTVINWPDFEPLEAKMQRTLGLDSSERVIMLMAVGYADPNGGVPFSQKKSLEVLRSYNRLSE
jgi:nitroreductase